MNQTHASPPNRRWFSAALTAGLALAAWLSPSSAQAQPDYPGAYWRPVYSGHWNTSGYGHKFHVIHDIEGYYWSTISYFQRSTTQASVHFYVNGKKDNASDAAPGEVSQGVRTAYYAWHARCWNSHSTGTEHEGFASNPAWYTAEMYQSSANLTRWLSDAKFGWAKDRNHVVGHGQKSVPGWAGYASANLGIDPYCNDHTDPGPYWDWSGYMARINPPSGPPTINPPYTWDSDGQGWTAGNSMSGVTWTGCCGWPGIIYNDQTGNDANNFSPPMNFGGGGDPSVNVSVYPQSGSSANHDMQVFWKTAQDNTWTASKSSPIVSFTAQNTYATINLDVNANWPTWFGKTINQMRLDFDNNNAGTRWIMNHYFVQTTPRFWFDGGTDGWNAGNGVVAPWQTACCGWPGTLVVDQNNNDGFITRDINSLGYRGAQNDRVYVRLFCQGGNSVNHDIKLYWATQLENNYTEAKSTPIINFSGNDQWVDVWFDVGANGYWHGNGPLTSLRLDFDANNHGTRFLIDQIQVVHNGSANFAPYNNASVVSISAPATVNAGAAFTATVTMNNSGNKAWTVDGTPHALGAQSPQDNARWGFTRVALPGTVNPGQNVTFTINATAPAALGTYAFDWKMLEEGVQWFGAMAQANITVISAGPSAPSGVSATAAAWNQVNVNWTDNSANETGFKVERSTDNVNFSVIATLGANVTSYQDTPVNAGTAYYYRVKSTNSGGDSAPSNTASVTTPNRPPDLAVIGSKTGTEGQALTFTATSSNPNQLINSTVWATWEGNNHNEQEIVFRKPGNSASTSQFIDGTVTNYTIVSSAFPAGGGGARVVKSSWSFKTGTSDYWIRLTTAGGGVLPNPTISLDQVLRFKIYSTKALSVGLGVRETGTTAAYGANGGTTGTIDWTAVSSVASGNPIATKAVAANTWTTVDINVPFEAQAAFTGDGVVASGKGVLEHLVLRGAGGTGVYDVYLDDMTVVEPNTLTYSLDAGAPSGATIHAKTGAFKWTPAGGQSGTYNITVRVTDRLGLTDFETIPVTIISVGNHPPTLAAIGNKTVNESSALGFTATANDQDAGQTLTFSLGAGAPSGASITTGGVFSWTPTEAQGPGSYPVTVRVTDNGAPASNAFETITVTVSEVNAAPVLAAIADQTINEGSALSATASATDADVPANSLTYSLDTGAPVGMAINSGNGAINWTTTEANGPNSYPVTVRVTDAGGLSDAKTFNVTVAEVNTAPVLTVNTTLTSVQAITDFEAMQSGTYNGTVLFRQPSFSSSTSQFIDPAATNYTIVTTGYPGGDGLNKALQMAVSFKTGTVNPWLRLSTYNTATLPNPTVNFTQRVRFKVYTDKAVGVALGLRETDTAAVIGQNGGVTGTMEWAGATASSGSPVPSRTVAAGSWTTLEFILPSETITAFTGNSVLTSTTGKGVLEHLALTPAGGSGAYNVYFDNFEVVTVTTNLTVNTGQTITFPSSATDADFPAQTLTYSLDAGAPTGATIDPATGTFNWTPTGAQGPSTNVITVRVTDNGPGSLSHTRNVTIVVNKVNTAPQITGVPDQALEINGGAGLNLTVTATDFDTNTLTFSLQGSVPSGAAIDPSTGVFTWTPPNTLSSNVITVRVTDNGVPALYDEREMVIVVIPTNVAPSLSLGTGRITEKVINYESVANYANDTVLFRRPSNSASTSSFLDTAVTNYSMVISSGIPAGNPNAGTKVQKSSWSFKTGTTNPWLRLTTFNSANLANPLLDLGARVKLDIYADKSVKVGLGLRETGGTGAVGSNGGTTGGIEWVGATKVGTSPNPSRVVNANTWTTLEFTLPSETCTNFTGGDSILAAGKGVLEHLAIVPNGGMGAYTLYLDNIEVVYTAALPSALSMNANATLTYTASATDPDPGSGLEFGLDADTPAGSAIDRVTGAFSWTPTAAGSYNLITYVNDNPVNGAFQKTTSSSFNVTVVADPLGPQGGDSAETAVGAGETVTLTWAAEAGQSYQVQVKEGADGAWTDLGTPVTGGSATVTNGDADSSYRIVAVGAAAE